MRLKIPTLIWIDNAKWCPRCINVGLVARRCGKCTFTGDSINGPNQFKAKVAAK
jgi:hypothetical protein